MAKSSKKVKIEELSPKESAKAIQIFGDIKHGDNVYEIKSFTGAKDIYPNFELLVENLIDAQNLRFLEVTKTAMREVAEFVKGMSKIAETVNFYIVSAESVSKQISSLSIGIQAIKSNQEQIAKVFQAYNNEWIETIGNIRHLLAPKINESSSFQIYTLSDFFPELPQDTTTTVSMLNVEIKKAELEAATYKAEYYRLRLDNLKKESQRLPQTTQLLLPNELKLPIPYGVIWKSELARLEFPNGKVFEYKDPTRKSARYFNLLVNNHGNEISHEVVKNQIDRKLTKEQIKNLRKTIQSKIDDHGLKKHILLKTTFRGGYSITIKW